jgi:hypothetical protein
MNETEVVTAAKEVADEVMKELKTLAETPVQDLEKVFYEASAEAQRLFRETLVLIKPKVAELIAIHTRVHDVYTRLLDTTIKDVDAVETEVKKVA